MRLTLRTLLAYLDDTLDPAQARQIGQKVAESPQAQELIERIKEVIRRRTTPPPLNSGDARIEANTLAEYIDSVLPSEKMTEVEEICLQSDIYLAEVASCHQVLSVVLSEPVLVPQPAKSRMYELIKGKPARRAAKPAQNDKEAELRPLHDAEEDETLLLGMPSLFREGSLGRRLLPIFGSVLLAVGLGVAIWFALPGRRPDPNAGTPVAKGDEDPLKGKNLPPEKTKEKTQEKTKEKEAPKGKDLPKVKDLPKTKEKPKTPDKPKTNEPPPMPDPPRGPEGEVGTYRLAGAIPSYLLSQGKEKDAWQRVKPDSPITSGVRLLSLPGFRSDVKTPGGVDVQLWGSQPERLPYFILESEAVFNVPKDDHVLDVTLLRGRIALINTKQAGEAKVIVRFKKEVWEINLLEPGSKIGMELWGLYPPGVPFSKEKGGEEPMSGVGLFALKGPSYLKVRYDTYLMNAAPGKNMYLWDNTGPASRPPQALAEDRLPSWAKKNPPPLTKEVQQAIVTLQKRLQGGQAADLVLAEAIKDKDVYLRVLAVTCLGAMNDLNHLVDALSNDMDRNVRVAAINVLRHWIGLAPENARELYQLLDRRYRSSVAEIIMSLLHDFSERQSADPHTYEALILYLKHDKLPVRELAFFHLARMAPQGAKIPYDPSSGNVDNWDNAVKQWKQLIPDGKLPPAPKQPR